MHYQCTLKKEKYTDFEEKYTEDEMLGIGVLWFEESKRTLAERIKAAEELHVKRVGCLPDYFEINPEDVVEGLDQVDGIPVRAEKSVLKNHVFAGRRVEKEDHK